MGNKLRHEGDEVRIKVIWPDKFVFIRKAFNLGTGNKPYCGYCWCVGNSVISRVAQPGGEAPHLEDNVWEWSTPSS